MYYGYSVQVAFDRKIVRMIFDIFVLFLFSNKFYSHDNYICVVPRSLNRKKEEFSSLVYSEK